MVEALRQRPGLESTFTSDTRFWNGIAAQNRAVLTPWLAGVAQAGVRVGMGYLFGPDAAGTLQKRRAPAVVATDWDLVNLAVEEWAREYSYELVGGLNETTQGRLQSAVADWTAAGEDFPALVARANAIFPSLVRAKMVAATEGTRAFAEGNTQAWEASGLVQEREWRTAVDERVCPICGALHGQRAKLGEPFRVMVNGIEFVVANPPAHVRCRCWMIPVVKVEAAMKLFGWLWRRYEEALGARED